MQYVGVNGIARTVSNMYVGVKGVARKVLSGLVGVNGIARNFIGVSFNTWSWTYIGTVASNAEATVTNLGGGAYQLHVKATNSTNTDGQRTLAGIVAVIRDEDVGKTLKCNYKFASTEYTAQQSYSDLNIQYDYSGGSIWAMANSSSGTISKVISYTPNNNIVYIVLTCGTYGKHEFTVTISDVYIGDTQIFFNV